MFVMGCTDKGDVVTWKHKSGTIDHVIVSVVRFYNEINDEIDPFFQKLNFQEQVKVKTFHVVPYRNEDYGLLTWTSYSGNFVKIGLFNLSNGDQIQCDLPKLK